MDAPSKYCQIITVIFQPNNDHLLQARSLAGAMPINFSPPAASGLYQRATSFIPVVSPSQYDTTAVSLHPPREAIATATN